MRKMIFIIMIICIILTSTVFGFAHESDVPTIYSEVGEIFKLSNK